MCLISFVVHFPETDPVFIAVVSDDAVNSALSRKNGCGVKGPWGRVCNVTDRRDVNANNESRTEL